MKNGQKINTKPCMYVCYRVKIKRHCEQLLNLFKVHD